MTEPVLQTLGRYTIRAEIGRGGFATVYQALDTSLNREVALKLLHPQLLTDRGFVERFRKEARTLANLRHPHIVTLYEVSEVEGRLFIAMELAHGFSLAQAIADRKRIPWADTLAILKPVSEALDYAHEQGIVHRDLKPANILLDAERGPLLTDFGFARLLGDNSASMSLSGGILGTPAYIAPEVWELDAAQSAADIYALGCIAYEMLTGEVLFVGKTPMQAMRAHDRGPQFPAAWPDDVPAGVERMLQVALARKPEDRYPKATTFWHALNDVEANAQGMRDQAERQAVADPWKAEVATALAAQEWSAARMAVGRWLSITPDDPQALAARDEIERQIQRERERQQMQAEAKRLRGETEEKAKREAEERERQRRAEVEARAAALADKSRREAGELDRQKQAAQAATLEKSKREAAERERQREAAEMQAQRSTTEAPHPATRTAAPTGASNKMKWRVYAAGGIIAVIAVGLWIVGNLSQPTATPTPPPAQSTVLPTPTIPATAAPATGPTAPPAGVPAVTTPVKLVLWTKEADSPLDEVKAVIADFTKANPNITVDMLSFNVEKLRENFQTSALAGTGPDLLWTVNDHAGVFALADLIQPVDNLSIDSSQFVPAAYAATLVNNNHYGIPLSYGNNLMLLVNKKLASKVPADTDELVSVARDAMARNPGTVGLAWFLDEPYWLVPWFGGFGGSVFSDAGKTATLDTPHMVAALTLMAKFKNTDKITPDACDYNCMDSMFKNGKAAMIINGDWSLGEYTNQPAIDLAIAPLPRITGAGLPQPYLSGTYIMFPKGLAGDKLAAAVMLTDYFISKDVQLQWVKHQKRLPSIQALYSDLAITGDPILEQVSAALVAEGVGMPPFASLRCFWDSSKPNLQAVLAGSLTPADAAAAMQKATDSCLSALK